MDVAWWPAFEIAPPRDEAAVRSALVRLADYDLALFVSPNAVQATAERLLADWPATTVIGAVGTSTRDAALAELRGAAGATVVAPIEGDESGSEGFWRAWLATGRRAHRVLLLRAATGRDWIVDQFLAADARLDAVAVYDRRARRLTDGDRVRLHDWVQAGAHPVTIVSSAEAVGAVLEQVAAVDGAEAWLRGGAAIATHPRIGQRLEATGFSRVEVCSPEDSHVVEQLESLKG